MVDEEIEYFQSPAKMHAFEKTRFMKESKRLSEMARKVTWDAIT